MHSKGWIGMDLDGTLAVDEGKYSLTMIGPAQPGMVKLTNQLLDAGHEVRIFTARVAGVEQLDGSPGFDPIEARNAIHAWLRANGLPALRCTAVKDQHCWFLIDDRGISVGRNSSNIADQNGYMVEALPELASVVTRILAKGMGAQGEA